MAVVVLPQEVVSGRCRSIPTSVEATAAVEEEVASISSKAEATRWASRVIVSRQSTGSR